MNINHNLNLVVLVGRVVMAIIAIATLFVSCTNNIIEKALSYVRKNIDEDYLAFVSSKASAMRCPISLVDPLFADTVYDLLEEYGEDNDLPENYWMEFGDIDDIVEQL